MSRENDKRVLGAFAAGKIQDGMIVGLGTGSTATCFIEELAKRVGEGLQISCVSTSRESEKLALSLGMEVQDLNTVERVDVVVDGADWVDKKQNCIKGYGGALVREKIVAQLAQEVWILVDKSKLTENLDEKKLPIEIIPFGWKHTVESLGLKGELRSTPAGQAFETDNGNFIFDATIQLQNRSLEDFEEDCLRWAGVVDTGLFLEIADHVFVCQNETVIDESRLV